MGKCSRTLTGSWSSLGIGGGARGGTFHPEKCRGGGKVHILKARPKFVV